MSVPEMEIRECPFKVSLRQVWNAEILMKVQEKLKELATVQAPQRKESQTCQDNLAIWFHPIFFINHLAKKAKIFWSHCSAIRSSVSASYKTLGSDKYLAKFPFLWTKVEYARKAYKFKCNQLFQACFKDKVFLRRFVHIKSEVALVTVTIESQSNYFHKILPSAFSLLIGACKYLVLSYIYQKYYSSLILPLRHRNLKGCA